MPSLFGNGSQSNVRMQFSEGGQLAPAGEKSLFSMLGNIIIANLYNCKLLESSSEAKILNVKSSYKLRS